MTLLDYYFNIDENGEVDKSELPTCMCEGVDIKDRSVRPYILLNNDTTLNTALRSDVQENNFKKFEEFASEA